MTIVFDHPAGEWLTRYILSLAEIIKVEFATHWRQVIPAYQSLTIAFDPLDYSPEPIYRQIEQRLTLPINIQNKQGDLIEIPVCYHIDFAPDITDLAAHCQLSIDQVIHLHSGTDYLVNMLGFLPGFLYLSGLDKCLHCPRKATPVLKVEAGAIGIGGDQTGVYPVASPGGWHIIGRTPLPIFAADSSNPFIANPLDKIRFIPIKQDEFEQLSLEYRRCAD